MNFRWIWNIVINNNFALYCLLSACGLIVLSEQLSAVCTCTKRVCARLCLGDWITCSYVLYEQTFVLVRESMFGRISAVVCMVVYMVHIHTYFFWFCIVVCGVLCIIRCTHMHAKQIHVSLSNMSDVYIQIAEQFVLYTLDSEFVFRTNLVLEYKRNTTNQKHYKCQIHLR